MKHKHISKYLNNPVMCLKQSKKAAQIYSTLKHTITSLTWMESKGVTPQFGAETWRKHPKGHCSAAILFIFAKPCARYV